MASVLGIGGLFVKSPDGAALRQWYQRVLGLEFADWGGVWFPAQGLAAQPGAGTVFSPMAEASDYFAPSTADFMFNLVVDDLDGMVARCRDNAVEPVKLFPDEGNGRFAHIIDPEGRKIELWQPKPMDGV